MAPITIAVDAMGGDHGLAVTLPAVKKLLASNPKVKILLVGIEQQLKEAIVELKLTQEPRLELVHASEIVEMDDPLTVALRKKRDSSMRVAAQLVKEGNAHAMVSAGNTGALMAVSRLVLRTMPGIDRPAICTAIPTKKHHAYMLDLGANVEADAEHLLQFALMGSAVAQAIDKNQKPKVALLNIGEEEIKGSENIKAAAQLLESHPSVNYVGYVEGDSVFDGDVDVVVCDGFVGNVALKTMEGVASMIGQMLKEEVSASWWRKITALLAMPIFKGLRHRADPQRYNGASLIGLNGIVVKSHGSANADGFYAALQVAFNEAEQDILSLIASALEKSASLQ